MLESQNTSRCKCHARNTQPATPTIGIENVWPTPRQPGDTIDHAIWDACNYEVTMACAHCGQDRTHTIERRIKAAPQYLRVQFDIHERDDEGNEDQDIDGNKMKNMGPQHQDPVPIDSIIDITQHQMNTTTPLRYKLIGVVYHHGEYVNDGHYLAAVTCYGNKKYLIDDDDISEEARRDNDQDPLTVNPMGWYRNDQNYLYAVTLWYERLSNPRPLNL